MMSGIKGRTFEQWAFRRSLNIREWMTNYSISTISELNEWCDRNDLIHPSSEAILSLFATPASSNKKNQPENKSKPKSRSRSTSRSTKKSKQRKEPWHTPAAERPRKKKE